MTALEIDKIRRKIVKQGFTSKYPGGSNEYMQYISNHYVTPGPRIMDLTSVHIKFIASKRLSTSGTTVINQWYVEITIEHGLSSYRFKTYDYYPDIVDRLLLKVKQYMAFEEFLKK